MGYWLFEKILKSCLQHPGLGFAADGTHREALGLGLRTALQTAPDFGQGLKRRLGPVTIHIYIYIHIIYIYRDR